MNIMLKGIGIFLAFVCFIFYSGCSQFPTQYDRVDSGTLRCLDFIYEPAEAAPGDTVFVRAIFAGKNISRTDIKWSVSYNLAVNRYGFFSGLDTVPLPLEYIDTSFSGNTSCIAFKFVIPEDIMLTSPIIPENWISLVPDYYRSIIPSGISGLDKSQILGIIHGLSQSADAGTLDISALDPVLKIMLPAMTQLSTVMFVLYAEPIGMHSISSFYTARYNSKFSNFPESGIYANTNPLIDSIGVHAVKKKGLQIFNPSDNPYETRFIRLYGYDDRSSLDRTDDSVQTVTIDDGYSYFIEAFTSNIDTALSIDAAISGKPPLVERHLSQWYFQFDQTEIKDVSPYDFMNIADMSGLIASVYPSVDSRVVSATVWCEIFDQLINEVYRPQGSALKEVRMRFKYTDRYMESLKKNIGF